MDKSTEMTVVDTMLEKGVAVKIPNQWPWRLLRRETSMIMRQPTLGVLYEIGGAMIKVTYDEEKLQENPIMTSWEVVVSGVDHLVYAIAMTLVKPGPLCHIRAKVLSRRLRRVITPSKLLSLALVFTTICNTSSFMNTTRLMRGFRMTEPKNSQGPDDHGG